MTTSTKWFICSFVITLLSGFACDQLDEWKNEIFYLISIPAISMMGISSFVIISNIINKGNHDRGK